VGPRAALDAVMKRKNPCSCREYNSSRPTRSLVTILTELPRLLCVNACMINVSLLLSPFKVMIYKQNKDISQQEMVKIQTK
jgi:hypothetical protein